MFNYLIQSSLLLNFLILFLKQCGVTAMSLHDEIKLSVGRQMGRYEETSSKASSNNPD